MFRGGIHPETWHFRLRRAPFLAARPVSKPRRTVPKRKQTRPPAPARSQQSRIQSRPGPIPPQSSPIQSQSSPAQPRSSPIRSKKNAPGPRIPERMDGHADPDSELFVCQNPERVLQTDRSAPKGQNCRTNRRAGPIWVRRLTIFTFPMNFEKSRKSGRPGSANPRNPRTG